MCRAAAGGFPLGAGQEVQSRSAWVLGDLAASVDTRYGESTLARYADDIGVAYESLKQYRRVAIAFPEKGGRLPFSAAQALAAQPDRLELAASRDWTVAQARDLVSSRREPAPLPEPAPAPAEKCSVSSDI